MQLVARRPGRLSATRDADAGAAKCATATPNSTPQYTGLFRELLTYMMEDPRNITPCTHLLFMAKNIERIGDHATNIAENTWFIGSTATSRRATRDKRDQPPPADQYPPTALASPRAELSRLSCYPAARMENLTTTAPRGWPSASAAFCRWSWMWKPAASTATGTRCWKSPRCRSISTPTAASCSGATVSTHVEPFPGSDARPEVDGSHRHRSSTHPFRDAKPETRSARPSSSPRAHAAARKAELPARDPGRPQRATSTWASSMPQSRAWRTSAIRSIPSAPSTR